MTIPTASAAPHSHELDAAKRDARAAALVARAGCDPAWGTQLAEHVLHDWPIAGGAVVSGFWPMSGEIDIRPLLEALHARGHVIVLPVTPHRGQPLSFRRWTPDMAMLRERFGTWCPPKGAEFTPDVLFIPLLAWDRSGRRLGYGGGYYDRTLPRLPAAVAIGCAFAAQELDVVPAADYDARLQAVATERGVFRSERD